MAFGISRLVGKDDNNDSVSSGTTVAAGADTTGAGSTDTTVAGASTTAASTASTVTTIAGKAITGDTPCPPTDGSAERTTSFEKAPPMCIDPAKKYTAVVDTNFGSFTIALDPKAAPKTVNNFVVLSLYHYYDGITCHRIVADFVVQCGDPKGDGTGGPGLRRSRTSCPRRARTSSARSRWRTPGRTPTAASSSSSAAPRARSCRPQYSLFGQVTDGLDTTINTIAALGGARRGRPALTARADPEGHHHRVLTGA